MYLSYKDVKSTIFSLKTTFIPFLDSVRTYFLASEILMLISYRARCVSVFPSGYILYQLNRSQIMDVCAIASKWNHVVRIVFLPSFSPFLSYVSKQQPTRTSTFTYTEVRSVEYMFWNLTICCTMLQFSHSFSNRRRKYVRNVAACERNRIQRTSTEETLFSKPT